MANKKISELTSLSHSDISGEDIALIVDVNSDGTGLPETKKTTMFELSRYLSSIGESGYGSTTLKNTTTNGNPTELFIDGVSEPFYLNDNTTIGFDVQLVGRRMDIKTENCYFTISGLITRGVGVLSCSMVGLSALNVVHRPNTNWSVLVSENQTNGSLLIRVLGESGKIINWIAAIRFVEIKG